MHDDEYESGPPPAVIMKHTSIHYELIMWTRGTDYYSIVVWNRGYMGNTWRDSMHAEDFEDAKHAFALKMNELEMYK